jgi:hypothetical protein
MTSLPCSKTRQNTLFASPTLFLVFDRGIAAWIRTFGQFIYLDALPCSDGCYSNLNKRMHIEGQMPCLDLFSTDYVSYKNRVSRLETYAEIH